MWCLKIPLAKVVHWACELYQYWKSLAWFITTFGVKCPTTKAITMKTLIIGAGPLGSLYTYLFHKAGKDVTLLARNEHYEFLKEHGLVLVNEFSQERMVEPVKVVNTLGENVEYDLVITLMRKNSLKKLLPTLSQNKSIRNFLFMGNNGSGFEEYLKYLPKEKILFGFPGGGGSRMDHIAHFVDSDKPGGKRMPITLGEIDGKMRERTRQIRQLFETSGVPVKMVDDMDSWLKYHIAFVLPVAGALLTSGDNYQLAKDKVTIRKYIHAVREGGRVLKSLGYKKSYNTKFKLFYLMPTGLIVNILSKVFNSKFAEVAMMMHARSAKDEMAELAKEFYVLKKQSKVATPHLDELMGAILPPKAEALKMHEQL
jgi:2-dehydropantoate 2-reductase